MSADDIKFLRNLMRDGDGSVAADARRSFESLRPSSSAQQAAVAPLHSRPRTRGPVHARGSDEEPPRIAKLVPRSGPINEAVRVVLHGTGLDGDKVRVRLVPFGRPGVAADVSMAEYVPRDGSSGQIVLEAVRGSRGVMVQASRDGANWGNAVRFSWSVADSKGDGAAGGKGKARGSVTTSSLGKGKMRSTASSSPVRGRSLAKGKAVSSSPARGKGKARSVGSSSAQGRSPGKGKARSTVFSPVQGRSPGKGKARSVASRSTVSSPVRGRSPGKGKARSVASRSAASSSPARGRSPGKGKARSVGSSPAQGRSPGKGKARSVASRSASSSSARGQSPGSKARSPASSPARGQSPATLSRGRVARQSSRNGDPADASDPASPVSKYLDNLPVGEKPIELVLEPEPEPDMPLTARTEKLRQNVERIVEQRNKIGQQMERMEAKRDDDAYDQEALSGVLEQLMAQATRMDALYGIVTGKYRARMLELKLAEQQAALQRLSVEEEAAA